MGFKMFISLLLLLLIFSPRYGVLQVDGIVVFLSRTTFFTLLFFYVFASSFLCICIVLVSYFTSHGSWHSECGLKKG